MRESMSRSWSLVRIPPLGGWVDRPSMAKWSVTMAAVALGVPSWLVVDVSEVCWPVKLLTGESVCVCVRRGERHKRVRARTQTIENQPILNLTRFPIHFTSFLNRKCIELPFCCLIRVGMTVGGPHRHDGFLFAQEFQGNITGQVLHASTSVGIAILGSLWQARQDGGWGISIGNVETDSEGHDGNACAQAVASRSKRGRITATSTILTIVFCHIISHSKANTCNKDCIRKGSQRTWLDHCVSRINRDTRTSLIDQGLASIPWHGGESRSRTCVRIATGTPVGRSTGTTVIRSTGSATWSTKGTTHASSWSSSKSCIEWRVLDC